MDETTAPPAAGGSADETLSRTEIDLEREKLKLERDRILLERERLNAARERLEGEARLHPTDRNGKLTVTLSTLIMTAVICALLGGILGAATATMTGSMSRNARIQQVMNQLAAASSATAAVAATNAPAADAKQGLPEWLQKMKPRGAHPDIAVVIVQ